MAHEYTRKHKGFNQVAQRKCLSCEKMFRSTWPGHRICDDCKQHFRYTGRYDQETQSTVKK